MHNYLNTFFKVDMGGVLASFLILGAGYGVGFRPLFEARSERHNLHQRLDASRKLAAQRRVDEKRIDTALADVRARISGAIRLSDRAQANHTISLITELAQNTGLIVESSTAGETRDNELHAIVPILLSGKGSFLATTRFIHALVEQYPDVNVRSFQIATNPAAAGETPEFHLELAWYVLPERDK